MPRKKDPTKKVDSNSSREKLRKERRSNAGRKKIEVSFEKIKKEINLDQVLYWIGLQATAEEIAGSFRVSTDTLNSKLQEYFGKNFTELKKVLGDGANGKLALRRNQFELSKTNASVAIWLGKQWLKQKDTIHNETVLTNQGTVSVYLPDNGRDDKDDNSEQS